LRLEAGGAPLDGAGQCGRVARRHYGIHLVGLSAIVHVDHDYVAGLIEAEKHAPLADAQAIPALQRPLQRSDVAATVGGKGFQGVNVSQT
jgi:hypothetical protein